MIKIIDEFFVLSTNNTTYVSRVNEKGILEHLYYGKRIELDEKTLDSFRALTDKVNHNKGTTINYSKDTFYQEEDMLLEVSSLGKGDFREPLIEVVYEDGSRTSDFIFADKKINEVPEYAKTLPNAYGDCEQLVITLKERETDVYLDIYFNVYEEDDVITRRHVLINKGMGEITINRLLSLQLDLDDSGYVVTSFGGAWAREMHTHKTLVKYGKFVNETNSGISSNAANPFTMLSREETSEFFGEAYGFNLIYSGNHCEELDVSPFFKSRFLTGINPTGFSWKLLADEEFETPEAVMTYSDIGFCGISQNMHGFVRNHIVRGNFAKAKRPILLNSWEASYFDINESKLLNLAKKAKEVGIELFVMDDGWFKGRNSDKSSLGDWVVDLKKLPRGVEHLAKKVHELGLNFGIWVEPEMVNEDSDLFRAHPEYAMTIPKRENSLGRNQMNLDLTNNEVIDYIKNSMRKVFSIPGINYVKWDMNRPFSDVYSRVLPEDRQGETMHRYYIGLYDILKTLTEEFPDILFEGCASGGNRFDLGILSYFPQNWASDDTDAIERTYIQTGLSYGYPMSVVTSHVSACPNHQTLRNTPLETRYNIASFGVLGYELNLCELKNEELEKIRVQVENYKLWRDVFFYGDFYRVSDRQWMVVSSDKARAVTVTWNEICKPNDYYKKLKTVGLQDDKLYHIYNIPLKHNLKTFGDLVNQVAPIHIKKDSLLHNVISKFVKMDGEAEDYIVRGDLLNNAGIKLCQAFGGTGYNDETRLSQDFDSRMYFIEEI